MTDAERAEKYRKSLKQKLIDEDEFERLEMFDENVEEAYLAGLKAGRPKWHRVDDGDYPPCEKGNYYSVNVLTDRGDIAYYNYDEESWVAEPSSAEIDPPIAWCELPKYEE